MTRLDSKSFLRGLGRALDIRGATVPRYMGEASWHRSDRAAMAADWSAVWGDMDRAYRRAGKRNPSHST